MRCTSCGRELAEGAAFCRYCGARAPLPKRLEELMEAARTEGMVGTGDVPEAPEPAEPASSVPEIPAPAELPEATGMETPGTGAIARARTRMKEADAARLREMTGQAAEAAIPEIDEDLAALGRSYGVSVDVEVDTRPPPPPPPEETPWEERVWEATERRSRAYGMTDHEVDIGVEVAGSRACLVLLLLIGLALMLAFFLRAIREDSPGEPSASIMMVQSDDMPRPAAVSSSEAGCDEQGTAVEGAVTRSDARIAEPHRGRPHERRRVDVLQRVWRKGPG
ncbi:MAG: zinc ribbon domain-containing protein [Armatimonadota bacterium]